MTGFTVRILSAVLGVLFYFPVYAQQINSGFPVLEEALRRQQIMGELDSTVSFSRRPLNLGLLTGTERFYTYFSSNSGNSADLGDKKKMSKFFTFLPLRNTLEFNTNRPYGWGNSLMIPNTGFQYYTTAGFAGRFHFINLQFQPEFVWAQNKPYQGFAADFNNRVNWERFFYWNNGDFPERFGNSSYSKFWWGQSKFTLSAGAFEVGISTENIWWGPGQFNALTFGNNAQGFPHLTLNTRRPAKTFLGSFEGQLIMGRLEDSHLPPSQQEALNDRYFNNFTGDWKYLNGISISYQPKWIPGWFIGFNRTFQQYNEDMNGSFREYFPIFDAFQKVRFGFDRDGEGRDQQVSVFSRYVLPKSGVEFYVEYGKRDHSYNWREFILNPNHARAFLWGFQKLFTLAETGKKIQVRGEMTHQQESVNRYIRYLGLSGNQTWHTHGKARGFTNFGQPLGVGIGVGSNVQTLEISVIDKLNKHGILLERLENHQDFYYRAFGRQNERKPWIDLSLGFLFDYHWDRLMISSKLQFIHASNYQWQLKENSTMDFPKGKNKVSVFGQAHFIYLFGTN